MENNLVSIIVISYNSEKFILETLQSIENQTFKNIELIISDDSSTDNTLEIAKKWCNEHFKRFAKIEIISSEKNTGISRNANRGLFAANGKWVKFIAADDILEKNCIKNNVEFAEKNPEAEIIFSKMFIFDSKTLFGTEFFNKKFYQKTAKQQFLDLCVQWQISTPTSFILRDFLLRKNGFDENFFIEDFPFFLKTTLEGTKLYGFDTLTAFYRKHSQSASTRNDQQFVNIRYFYDVKKTCQEIIFPNTKKFFLLRLRWKLFIFVNEKIIKKGNKLKDYNIFLTIINNFDFVVSFLYSFIKI